MTNSNQPLPLLAWVQEQPAAPAPKPTAMAPPQEQDQKHRGTQDPPPCLALRVHVPIACFRHPYARNFVETYPLAPPSTAYGMLLSMVGEERRARHIGARLALGRLRESAVSRVLRTFYRWKDAEINASVNRAPDWQELLTDVRLVVWLSSSPQEERPTLQERVWAALNDPASVERFGGLSLGESTHLVDGVWPLKDRPQGEGEELDLLCPDPKGDLSLPIWPDHVGSAGTRWGRFYLRPASEVGGWPSDEGDWTTLEPPAEEE